MDDYSVIHDFFQLCVRVMFSLFFFIFNRMLNDFLTPNLNQSNLSRVVNITLFTNFLNSKAFHIESHVPLSINKMGPLNTNTVTLLKPI